MFADNDSAVCQRKPTRPSIISPPAAPVTYEVAPSGHKKIPSQPSLICSVRLENIDGPQASVIAPPIPSMSTSVGELLQRNILQEMGLELSSDDELVEIPLPPTKPTIKCMPQNTPPTKDLIVSNELVEIPLPPTKPTITCMPQNTPPTKDLIVSTKITPPPKTAIMIPIQPGPERCNYRFVKGGKKGTVCDKKSVRGQQLCANHIGLTKRKSDPAVSEGNKSFNSKVSVSPPSVVQTSQTESALRAMLDETKQKLSNLERVVLNLLKDPKQPAATSATKSPNKKVKNSANKLKHSHSLIQRIRMYKLNFDETYKLIRYKDGLPIVQSKNRLYQVVLPRSFAMRRPIPNGKWSLVCSSEYPEMIWKEV